MMKLPVAKMPAVISASTETTLAAHALKLSPDVLRELGNNIAQALYSLDLAAFGGPEEPSTADRLRVGATMRALAAAGHPNPETAEVLARVGDWLVEAAQAEVRAAIEQDRKARRAHADTLSPGCA